MRIDNNSNIFSKLTGCLKNLRPETALKNDKNIVNNTTIQSNIVDNILPQASHKISTTRNGTAGITLRQVHEKKTINYHISTKRKKASKTPKMQSIHEDAEYEHAAKILQNFAKMHDIKAQSYHKYKTIKKDPTKINSLLSVTLGQRMQEFKKRERIEI